MQPKNEDITTAQKLRARDIRLGEGRDRGRRRPNVRMHGVERDDGEQGFGTQHGRHIHTLHIPSRAHMNRLVVYRQNSISSTAPPRSTRSSTATWLQPVEVDVGAEDTCSQGAPELSQAQLQRAPTRHVENPHRGRSLV